MTIQPPLDFDPFVAKLAGVTNAGRSGDDSDLYAVYGQMEAYLRANSPRFACQAGCIQCCFTRMPMVSSLEWQALFAFLRTQPVDVQARIIGQAAMLRPLADSFARTREAVFQSQGHVSGASAQCPMLLDGQCSVYAARPLPCRVYGYTAGMVGEQPVFLGCNLATAHVQYVAKDGLQVPSSQPLTKRMEELNEGHGGWTWAYLPQWVWAHSREGRFVDEVVWLPDFRSV